MHMVTIVQTPFNILPTRFRITSISSEKTYEVLKECLSRRKGYYD
jgi:hypothetical protein